MDLSGNLLSTFPELPAEYQSLININLSRNIIDLTSFPIVPLNELQLLDLSFNKINSLNLLPNLLVNYRALQSLNLAKNLFTSLPDFLRNPSLKSLNLSYCQISKIRGDELLQGFPRLEILSLQGNPLRSVSELASISLTNLDLSNCKLTHLKANLLENLPNLIQLNLARNSRLSLTRKSGEIVHSDSVRILDLSYCNMESIEISGFPNLTGINLKGNLIKHVMLLDFSNNAALENIDLSSNAIAFIAPDAFNGVIMLKNLDISFNTIRFLENHTFAQNTKLTSINLSRNFLADLSRLSSNSITHLNVSWCEVLTLHDDALNDLPELVELDLSNNLFSELPIKLQSNKLQRLDLRMCRSVALS